MRCCARFKFTRSDTWITQKCLISFEKASPHLQHFKKSRQNIKNWLWMLFHNFVYLGWEIVGLCNVILNLLIRLKDFKWILRLIKFNKEFRTFFPRSMTSSFLFLSRWRNSCINLHASRDMNDDKFNVFHLPAPTCRKLQSHASNKKKSEMFWVEKEFER